MFWLPIIFALISQLPITSATVQCIKCAQTLDLTTSEAINTLRPECKLQNATSTMCMATLRIDYQQNNALVSFTGTSEDLFNITLQNIMFTHSVKISFGPAKLESILQIYCSFGSSCIRNIQDAYRRTDSSNVKKLRDKLQGELFNSSGSADLICDNNQNETIPCPNGICQLIDNGASGYTRNCIPESFSTLSPSILLGSSIVGEDSEDLPFIMYMCNQNMCNNLKMAENVRKSLNQYGLSKPFDIQQPFVLETTTTSSKSSVVKMFYQSIISIQCCLLLVTTLFLKKI